MVCREHDALSAYLLGALDPAERRAIERHVADCARCRAELVQLAPLVGLLRHTPFEELSETAAAKARHPTTPHPQSTAVAPVGASPIGAGAFAFTGRHLHRPGRILTTAAVTVAVAGAGLGIYLGAVASGPASPRPALTASATSPGTRISASATLTPNQSGTAIQLKLTGLPSAITCHLVVHARDGRTETAATWASGYSTAVSIPASTSISPQDISTLDVLDASDRLLVRIPQT
ncbi:anti-sigma factor [Streptacidiphilus sp. EB103A]|uniref:anti-sigma factor family protein n=1 Tax=Streptacidiphilus sp. EB103A TaxID=3156275 RepID=UPI003518A06C